jgi:oligopeptide/dipeptide ABC transporter ATP-binding protein
MAENGKKILLQVKGLKTYFDIEGTPAKAVDGVDFHIYENEVFGLVGESGCGKSVTALSIMRLVPNPPGWIEAGEVLFRGRDLLALPLEEVRRVRGAQISMIFQEPMTSLNPVFSIGWQVKEAVWYHNPELDKQEILDRAVGMLEKVGIPSAADRLKDYPHQFSGGMRQRVMIAMALACNPALLIADEPTTALDVTIQAQILDLLKRLQRELGMAVLLITHDLGVVAETADRVAVMYAGQIVELGGVRDLFARPCHPYTAGLQASRPRLGEARERLRVIAGNVPDPVRFPAGCRFHPRCAVMEPRCLGDPPVVALEGGRRSRCWRAAEIAAGTLAPAPGEERDRA